MGDDLNRDLEAQEEYLATLREQRETMRTVREIGQQILEDPPQGPAIQIGGGRLKDALEPVAKAIVDIINVAPDRETAVAALDTMRHLTEIKAISIQDCTFDMGAGAKGIRGEVDLEALDG